MKKYRLKVATVARLLLVGFLFSMVTAAVGTLASTSPVYAATTGTWQDQYNIIYNNIVFTEGFNGTGNVGGINGNDMTLQVAKNCVNGVGISSPPSVMDVNPYQTSRQAKVTIYTLDQTGPRGRCNPTTQIINLTNTYDSLTANWPGDWSKLTYGWQTAPEAGKPSIAAGDNSGQAVFVQSNISTDGFTMTLNGPAYVGGPCNPGFNQLTVGDHNNPYTTATQATLLYQATPGSGNVCANKKITVKLSNVYNTVTNPTGAPPTGSTSNTDGCAITDDSPLRFLLCPLFLLANSVLNTLNSLIQNMLYTPVDQIFANNIPSQTVSCTPTGTSGTQKCTTNPGTASFQDTFNAFRNIGIGLMIIAGIVMVGAQAAGLEVFSPYTVRKALPRIVSAIIGMVLAWPILKFAVIFFNDLGVWASSLILVTSHVQTSAFGQSDTIGLWAYLLGATGVLVVALGWGILGLLGTAFLALLVGFIVIAIVKLGTILLILTFPLAIACSVLPGTQKIWNLCREWLIGLLMAFPVIMAFLAAGKAASSISAAAGAADTTAYKTTWYLLAFFVLIAPYFLLSTLPRLIGGVFSTIHGLVGGHSLIKGGFDTARKFRQGEQKYLHERRMEGKGWLGSGRTGRGYRRFFTPHVAPGASYREFDRKRLALASEEALKHDQGFAANNDVANEIASRRGMNRGQFIQEYMSASGASRQQAASALGMIEQSYGASMGSDAMRVAAFKASARSSTSYRGVVAGADGDTVTGQRRMYADAGDLVASGLMSQDEATQAIKFSPGAEKRRERSGAGYGAVSSTIGATATAIRGGARYADITSGAATTSSGAPVVDVNSLRKAAVFGTHPGEFIAGRQEALEAAAPIAVSNLMDAITSGNQHTIDQNLAQIDSIYNVLKSTSPEKAQIWADNVMNQGAPAPGGGLYPPTAPGKPQRSTVTVRQAIEFARQRRPDSYGRQTFLDLSREYNSAYSAGAANAAAAAGSPNP